jgi:hypothetical protein
MVVVRAHSGCPSAYKPGDGPPTAGGKAVAAAWAPPSARDASCEGSTARQICGAPSHLHGDAPRPADLPHPGGLVAGAIASPVMLAGAA